MKLSALAAGLPANDPRSGRFIEIPDGVDALVTHDEAESAVVDLQLEIARLKAALARSEALVARHRAETQHRIRNLLSVVRAISSRGFERATSLEQLAQHQSGRIAALARVEEALDSHAGEGADLEHLLWDEWLVVLSTSEEWRAEARGPSVLLAPRSAERIGLAFHELTTNALKFGAFSSPHGRASVQWRIFGDTLEINWSEAGVPLMNIGPKHAGFGRDLLERALPYDLRAETKLSFSPGGVRCSISLPMADNVVPRS